MIKITDSVEIPLGYTGIAEYPDGTKRWFLNRVLHRENGPAYEGVNGGKEWYLNGKLHREDGPAIVKADGEKQWYLNGKLHREDGPACEYVNGDKVWYLNGIYLFELPPKSQPFVFLEEFADGEGKEQIKVLTQNGIEIWPDLPNLKELAENWEGVKQ